MSTSRSRAVRKHVVQQTYTPGSVDGIFRVTHTGSFSTSVASPSLTGSHPGFLSSSLVDIGRVRVYMNESFPDPCQFTFFAGINDDLSDLSGSAASVSLSVKVPKQAGLSADPPYVEYLITSASLNVTTGRTTYNPYDAANSPFEVQGRIFGTKSRTFTGRR